jgi:hypothetical protein
MGRRTIGGPSELAAVSEQEKPLWQRARSSAFSGRSLKHENERGQLVEVWREPHIIPLLLLQLGP